MILLLVLLYLLGAFAWWDDKTEGVVVIRRKEHAFVAAMSLFWPLYTLCIIGAMTVDLISEARPKK